MTDKSDLIRLTLAAALLAGTANAATITEVPGPAVGLPVELDPGDFTGRGPCGSGQSVINDGCSVVIKDETSPRPYGRFDPLGVEWIDSQDRRRIAWTPALPEPITSLTFALTDAFDQPHDARYGGGSFFRLRVDDALWEIPAREANGTLHWLTVAFDRPTIDPSLRFITRLNDGWGVSSATATPVPIPAALPLLIGGLGLLAWRARRKT